MDATNNLGEESNVTMEGSEDMLQLLSNYKKKLVKKIAATVPANDAPFYQEDSCAICFIKMLLKVP